MPGASAASWACSGDTSGSTAGAVRTRCLHGGGWAVAVRSFWTSASSRKHSAQLHGKVPPARPASGPSKAAPALTCSAPAPGPAA